LIVVARHESRRDIPYPATPHARALGKPVFKACLLGLIVVYTVVLVAVSGNWTTDSLVRDYLTGLPVLIFAMIWCLVDAKERGRRIGIGMRFSLIFLFAFAFPLYIHQTRGPRGFVTWEFAAIYAASMVTLLLRYF